MPKSENMNKRTIVSASSDKVRKIGSTWQQSNRAQ